MDEEAAVVLFAVFGRGSVGRLLDSFCRSSACMPERTSSRREENVWRDWRACFGLGMEVGACGGQVVLLLRWPRRAERLEDEVDGTCEVAAVELCVVEARCEVVGRLDVWVMVVL